MEQKILSLKEDKILSEVELFEYPEELRGGRNLLSLSNIAISNGRLIAQFDSVRFIYSDPGYYTTGKIATANFNNLTLSISNIPTGYVALGFFDGEDIYRSRPIMQIANIIENFTVVVPSWAAYCRVSFKGNDSGFIKLEKGTKATDWTPAPEDLNLSYPDFITEFKPSISDKYILTEELIEYPEELSEGRNLIVRHNEIKNTWINTKGVIASNSTTSTMSTYIPVIPGDIFTFSKKTDNSPDGGAFRWRWFDENENYLSRSAKLSNLFTWVVPNGAYYIQVSYPNSSEAQPKLEKGNKATDWTPAPEDLGLSYPDHIQSFGTSFGNNILINEFIEQ